MSKTVSSSWDPATPPSPGVLASTFDNTTPDGECIEDHLFGVSASVGFGNPLTSVSTTWPGLPAPVLTTALPGDTAATTLRRHKLACAAALLDNPITPS